MGGLLNNGSLGRERTDSALGAAAADASMTAPPFYHTGGGSPGDRNYPILPSAPYEAPGLLAGLPASYSPWVQPSNIPDSLWNYQPPELVDWDMSNRVPWGWADTPVSEFAPEEESPPTGDDGEGTQRGGGSQPDLAYGDGGDYSHLPNKGQPDIDFFDWLAGLGNDDEGGIVSVGDPKGGNVSDF